MKRNKNKQKEAGVGPFFLKKAIRGIEQIETRKNDDNRSNSHTLSVSLNQGDQMERMYVQYLAIYKYENLPIPIHFLLPEWVQKFSKY